MPFIVSERTIEDILSADRTILADLLQCNPAYLSVVARQKVLKSGKLDLLCLYEDGLILIELKVVPFYPQIIQQINGYQADLVELQNQNRLISAHIRKVVLVTAASSSDVSKCADESIELHAYRPDEVLAKYFGNFREAAYFLQIQSADYGVVRLGLLNTTLRLLADGKTLEQICSIEARAPNTIRNRLSVAEKLGLVARYQGVYFLTEMGTSFVEEGERTTDSVLSENQAALMADFVRENPFYSSVTYTILSFLETVFVLAKSEYPVTTTSAQTLFVKSVGKEGTWKTPKAQSTATYIFSNYACELHLLASIGNSFYITPGGIQAILLLQLNRSIKLIGSYS